MQMKPSKIAGWALTESRQISAGTLVSPCHAHVMTWWIQPHNITSLNTMCRNLLQWFMYPPGGAVIMQPETGYCHQTAVMWPFYFKFAHYSWTFLLTQWAWSELLSSYLMCMKEYSSHRVYFIWSMCYYHIIRPWKCYAKPFCKTLIQIVVLMYLLL